MTLQEYLKEVIMVYNPYHSFIMGEYSKYDGQYIMVRLGINEVIFSSQQPIEKLDPFMNPTAYDSRYFYKMSALQFLDKI